MADSSYTSSSKDVLRLFKRLLLLLLILIACDRLGGVVIKNMYQRLEVGQFGPKINAVIRHPHELIIFGSSRVENQYMATIVSEETGLSSYNAGFGGQSILFHYGLEQLVLKKYTPKLVLLDMNLDDFTDHQRQHALDKLSILLPYADNSKVYDLVAERGTYERLKLLSAIYPYNSQLLQILKFTLRSDGSDRWRGFFPLYGSKMPRLIELAEAGQSGDMVGASAEERSIDPVWVERFIDSAREAGVRVVLVNSPRYPDHGFFYNQTELETLDKYRRWLKKKNVPLLEVTHEQVPELANPELYSEPIHLNFEGAQIFSHHLGRMLREQGFAKPPVPGR